MQNLLSKRRIWYELHASMWNLPFSWLPSTVHELCNHQNDCILSQADFYLALEVPDMEVAAGADAGCALCNAAQL